MGWFEELVSSDDLEGLRFVRDRTPAGMDIATGEYGYDLFYFRQMLEADAVDVLQADATRCAGVINFLQAGTLCQAARCPFSRTVPQPSMPLLLCPHAEPSHRVLSRPCAYRKESCL